MRHQPCWRLIAFWVMVMLVEVGGEHVDPQVPPICMPSGFHDTPLTAARVAVRECSARRWRRGVERTASRGSGGL